MATRYVRDEELIADVLRSTRRSNRNANAPTGTEKNQTTQKVEDMVPVVADALQKAQDAIDAAADAVTTSNGKNSRRRGQTEPEAPLGGWVAGDQWIIDNADGVPYAVAVWNGTAFVPEQLLAAELLVASGGGLVRLADGVVTADAVAADAIDGMTITGATMRTAPSGQRMQFDINGLRAFNTADQETIALRSEGDGFVMRNDANNSMTFSSFSGFRYDSNKSGGGAGHIILEPRGLSLTKNFDLTGPVIHLKHGVGPDNTVSLESTNAPMAIRSQGNMTLADNGGAGTLSLGFAKVVTTRVEMASSQVSSLDVVSRVKLGSTIESDSGAPFVENSGSGTVTVRSGTSVGNLNKVVLNAANEIVLDAPKVTFQGDTDWVNVVFMSGWQNNTGAPTQWRIKHGQLQISGRISRTNATAIGASYTQFSQPNSAIAQAVASLPNTTAITPGSGPTQQGLLLINADGSMSCAAAGGVIFIPNATYLL